MAPPLYIRHCQVQAMAMALLGASLSAGLTVHADASGTSTQDEQNTPGGTPDCRLRATEGWAQEVAQPVGSSGVMETEGQREQSTQPEASQPFCSGGRRGTRTPLPRVCHSFHQP